ncbi:protein of unknown function [Xenorhabdus nematophila AN6/1]|nr:protein of unknown function [Xenorhabdus nematophila AN6/1]
MILLRLQTPRHIACHMSIKGTLVTTAVMSIITTIVMSSAE